MRVRKRYHSLTCGQQLFVITMLIGASKLLLIVLIILGLLLFGS
jgi:hypothetical protein